MRNTLKLALWASPVVLVASCAVWANHISDANVPPIISVKQVAREVCNDPSSYVANPDAAYVVAEGQCDRWSTPDTRWPDGNIRCYAAEGYKTIMVFASEQDSRDYLRAAKAENDGDDDSHYLSGPGWVADNQFGEPTYDVGGCAHPAPH